MKAPRSVKQAGQMNSGCAPLSRHLSRLQNVNRPGGGTARVPAKTQVECHLFPTPNTGGTQPGHNCPTNRDDWDNPFRGVPVSRWVRSFRSIISPATRFHVRVATCRYPVNKFAPLAESGAACVIGPQCGRVATVACYPIEFPNPPMQRRSAMAEQPGDPRARRPSAAAQRAPVALVGRNRRSLGTPQIRSSRLARAATRNPTVASRGERHHGKPD